MLPYRGSEGRRSEGDVRQSLSQPAAASSLYTRESVGDGGVAGESEGEDGTGL